MSDDFTKTKEQESNPLKRIISLAFALICCYEFSWQSGQHPIFWRKCLYLQMFCRLILQSQNRRKGRWMSCEMQNGVGNENCLSQNPWWLNGLLSCLVLKLSYCPSAGRQGSPSPPPFFFTLWIQTLGSESYNFALTDRHSKAFSLCGHRGLFRSFRPAWWWSHLLFFCEHLKWTLLQTN